MADTEHILPSDFKDFIKANTGKGKGKIDPRVAGVYNALAKYAASDARREWHEQRAKCKKAAFENEFFTDKELKELRDHYQEPVPINRLVSGIQGTSAIATASNPRIDVLPLRETDPFLSALCADAIEHVWAKNSGNDVVYDFVEEKNVGGIGCIYAKIDENRGPFGAVVFEEDEIDNWYWDETSRKRDKSDSHLLRAQLRSIAYIKAHYDLKDADVTSIDGSFANDGTPDKLEDTVSGEDAYTRDEKTGSGPFYSPPGDVSGDHPARVWEIEAYMLHVEREHWATVSMGQNVFVIRLGGVNGKKQAEEAIARLKVEGIPMSDGQPPVVPDDIVYWPRILHNRYKMIVVGTKLIGQPNPEPDDPNEEVLQIRNPLGLDSDGDPVLPVVFYLGQRTTKAYHRGPTFYAFDSNKSLCKRKAQYSLAVSKNLSAPIARDVSSKWRDSNRPDMPGNELLMNKGDRDPVRLQPSAVDFGAMTQDMIEDKANIDDAYGVPEVAKGKVPQNLERMSGRLGLALQDASTLMQSPSTRGLESSLTRLGKMIFSLILKSWPKHKWEALVTEKRIREFVPEEDKDITPDSSKTIDQRNSEFVERQQRWMMAIDKIMAEGIGIIDFDVLVTAGSSLPTNRLLRQEEALEFYDKGLFDRKAALEHSGHPNAKEVAERMDEREMQMMQAKSAS